MLLMMGIFELVNDKELGMKIKYKTLGLDPLAYWLGIYTSDVIVGMTPFLLVVVLVGALQIEAYSGIRYFGFVLLGVCFFTFGLFFGYLLSYTVSTQEMASLIIPNVLIFMGVTPHLIV